MITMPDINKKTTDPMERIEEVNKDLQAYKQANDERVKKLCQQTDSSAKKLSDKIGLLRHIMEKEGYIPSNNKKNT